MGQSRPFSAAQLQNELFDALTIVEGVDRSDDMPAALQRVVKAAGFDSYAFLDGAADAVEGGRVITTVSRDWQETYLGEGFAEHDPCTARGLSSNRPFLWTDIPLGEIASGPSPARSRKGSGRCIWWLPPGPRSWRASAKDLVGSCPERPS